MLLALISAASPAFAQAPANPAPQPPKPTMTTFGDWVLTCRKGAGADTGREACEITQTFTAQGQTAPFARMAVGRISPKAPFNVTVVVPHNVSFPSTVALATDEKGSNPMTLNWTRCLATGCFASGQLTDAAIAIWRPLAQRGRLSFKNALGQDVALPLSFNGFNDAFNALAKK